MLTSGNTSGINPLLLNHFYDASLEELYHINSVSRGFSDTKLKQFVMIYRNKRKDEQTILLTCLLGIICFAGIHRFLLGQIGMGILYILTGGLCLIGTIVDAINYKKLTLDFNKKMIMESLSVLDMLGIQ
jgi:TM2 domain-containing membrane protein YozV